MALPQHPLLLRRDIDILRPYFIHNCRFPLVSVSPSCCIAEFTTSQRRPFMQTWPSSACSVCQSRLSRACHPTCPINLCCGFSLHVDTCVVCTARTSWPSYDSVMQRRCSRWKFRWQAWSTETTGDIAMSRYRAIHA